jgi:hemerythrin-like metal-binding protein
MAYFEWVDDLVIDRGPIDFDHRRLADMVNDLHQAAIEAHDSSVIGARMAELIFYTQDHLLREEEVMAAVGFPDLVAHRQSHVLFMDHLHGLQRRFGSAANTTTAVELAQILRDWLSNHIREADGDLRRYLGHPATMNTVAPVTASDLGFE